MVMVIVNAGVHRKYRTAKARTLRVRGTHDAKYIPRSGDWLTIELPVLSAHRSYRFLIQTAEVCWRSQGESWELSGETFHQHLVDLAVIHGWHVIDGLDELSPAQPDVVACAQGMCAHGIS